MGCDMQCVTGFDSQIYRAGERSGEMRCGKSFFLWCNFFVVWFDTIHAKYPRWNECVRLFSSFIYIILFEFFPLFFLPLFVQLMRRSLSSAAMIKAHKHGSGSGKEEVVILYH